MFDALPDPGLFERENRPVCGRDLTLLRQWTGLTIADCAYLLGITVPRFHDYQNRPDQPLGDPAVSLLVWALLRYPEVHYLPAFPEPAEVYPAYAHALQHSGVTGFDAEGAFSLLMGQPRKATERWLSGIGSPRQTVHPPLRRLLLAFQRFLAVRGVAGFEAFVDRARFEARVRGLDLDSPTLKTWTRPVARRRSFDEPGLDSIGVFRRWPSPWLRFSPHPPVPTSIRQTVARRHAARRLAARRAARGSPQPTD